jgi:HAD superfamily hydrolase (TIGR01509 family)
MSGFGLIVFDCDGVLVDSERLAVRTEASILENLGWPLTESEIIDRFVGRSADYMHKEIERELARSIDWEVEFEARYRQVFEQELVPVEGVVHALDQIATPACVASSGTHAKIRSSLELTGLLDRFTDRIFSVEDVEHGKPDPDLFLYAARKMGVAPRRCAVIEDSVSGVSAGLAAGMQVFAFSGGVTDASKLSREGVVVFDDMLELPDLLLAG